MPQSNKLKSCIITKDLTPQQRETNKLRRQNANKATPVQNDMQEEQEHNFKDTTITSCETTITKSSSEKSKNVAFPQNYYQANNSLSLESQNLLKPINYGFPCTNIQGASSNIDPDETLLGGNLIQSHLHSNNDG